MFMSLSVNLVKKREGRKERREEVKGEKGTERFGKLLFMPSSMAPPGGSYLGVKFQNETK